MEKIIKILVGQNVSKVCRLNILDNALSNLQILLVYVHLFINQYVELITKIIHLLVKPVVLM